MVILGNGQMTSFWLDLWCGSLPLAASFPALFSHVTRPHASVAKVLSTPVLQLSLQPRLSNAASMELLELQALVSPTQLNEDAPDSRVFRHNLKPLSTKEHYMLSFDASEDDPFATEIWHNLAPPKCKFFLWLLHRRRLNTNGYLSHCNMRPDGECPFCSGLEDCSHLFLSCPRARSLWSHLNFDLTMVYDIEQVWSTNPLQELDQRIRSTVLTCILWNLWKCRNAKVFRSEDDSNAQITTRCRDDLLLWSLRCNTLVDKRKTLVVAVG